LPSLGQSHSAVTSQAQRTKSVSEYSQSPQQKEEWPKLQNKLPTLQSESQQLWKSFQQSRKEKEESSEKNRPLLDLKPSTLSNQASKAKPMLESNKGQQQKEEWPKLKNKQ